MFIGASIPVTTNVKKNMSIVVCANPIDLYPLSPYSLCMLLVESSFPNTI